MLRDVPDAFGAVVAAVLRDQLPGVDPEPVARQVLVELRRQGWHVGAPGACVPNRGRSAAPQSKPPYGP